MQNTFAVLSYEGGPIEILGSDIIVKQTGVNELLSSVQAAVEWLSKNTTWKLIISMPIEENQRRTIAMPLQQYNDRCIAMDPPLLRQGSTALFRHTEPIEWNLLSHIRKIVNKKD